MNIYGSIGIVFSYSALTILDYSNGHTAKQVATVLFILAVLCAVMMVVCAIRQSFVMQVRDDSTVPSIDDNSPRTEESTISQNPLTHIEPEAAPSHIEQEKVPSPTPSYGPSEKSQNFQLNN